MLPFLHWSKLAIFLPLLESSHVIVQMDRVRRGVADEGRDK